MLNAVRVLAASAVVALVGALFAPAALAQTAGDVEQRDHLIADQENLLNAYRCLFDVDTELVPGGCPTPDVVVPGPAPANPTQNDIDVRDGLIQNQEALLNVYRCRFDVDTEIVPGGCVDGAPVSESDPTTMPATDRVALMALYEATGGADWLKSDNWGSGAPIGEWHGVFVDDRERVTLLILSDNNLRGEIPPELGDLSELTNLYLSDNQLSGAIPPELGNLTNLEALFLSGNQLSGPIPPELGNLTNLGALHLQNNQLSGTVPPELGNLPDVFWVFLWGNQVIGCSPTLPDNALVIVNSPSPGAVLESGFEATGCSRTFESNVQWRLLGRSGEELASGHTSGGGVEGPAPFRFTADFDETERQLAYLEVFEEDASGGEGYPPPRVIVPVIIGTGDPVSGCDATLPDNALVIVNSPTPSAEFEREIDVAGCSRTFESNVQWRLLGRSGEELASGHTSGGGVEGPAPFQFTVDLPEVKRQVAHLEVFEEDVSEGQGFPPPRAIVPIVIGFYMQG